MQRYFFSLPVLFAALLAPGYGYADEPPNSNPQAEFFKLLNSMAAMGEEASKQRGGESYKALMDFKKQLEQQAQKNEKKPDGKTPETLDDFFGPIMSQLTGLAGGSMNVLGAMAREEMQQNQQAQPRSRPNPLVGKAAILAVQGKSDEAIAAYQQALEQNPEDGAAFFGIASTYASKGMTAQALAALGKAIAFDEKYRGIAQRDTAFSTLGADERFKSLVRARDLSPSK